jgi:hypothetical protein
MTNEIKTAKEFVEFCDKKFDQTTVKNFKSLFF